MTFSNLSIGDAFTTLIGNKVFIKTSPTMAQELKGRNSVPVPLNCRVMLS